MPAEAETSTRVRPRAQGGRPTRFASAQLSERILEAATALFLVDGFAATSIEAVARRAGVSKRTFYHRFRSKEALFEEVVRRLVERWTPPFEPSLLDGPSLDDGLRRAAQYILAIALTPEALALHCIVTAEARRIPGLPRILHDLAAAAGIERIGRHLAERIAVGELGPIDPSFAAEQFILMVVSGPRRRALGLGPPLGPAELTRWIDNTVALFLRGCRSG